MIAMFAGCGGLELGLSRPVSAMLHVPSKAFNDLSVVFGFIARYVSAIAFVIDLVFSDSSSYFQL